MTETDNRQFFNPLKPKRDQERSLDGILEDGVIGKTVTLFENITQIIYDKFDRFLVRKDINLNEDNGFMINSTWYLIHGLQKFPRFLKTLKTKDRLNIEEIGTSLSNYFRNGGNIQKGEINGVRYMAINIPERIRATEDIVQLCQKSKDGIKLAISNCAKGHLLHDEPEVTKISDYNIERTSPSRLEDHVVVCPLRHEDFCAYSSEGKHTIYKETCCKTPCRTGEIAELLNKNEDLNIEMSTILSSFAAFQNGFGDGIVQRESELYLIETCVSTGRHLETVGRMYPDFKAVVFFYEPTTSCRTFSDRPIRKGKYRERIIPSFLHNSERMVNPIYDIVARIESKG